MDRNNRPFASAQPGAALARPATTSRRPRGVIVACCAVVGGVFAATPLYGAGSPANVLLLVNADSYASKTVANYYAQLRDLPDSHVVHLENVPPDESAEIGDFREKILKPALAAIRDRRLESQIDYIVYSDGFPTRIKLWTDTLRHKERQFPQHFKAVGAINALTYYADQVLAEKADYIDLSSNRYMRVPRRMLRGNPFAGPLANEFQEATAAYDQGRVAEAGAKFAALIAKQPDQPLTYYHLARAQARQGLLDEAEASLRTAMAKGWCDAELLEIDAALAPCRERSSFAELQAGLPALPDSFLPTTGFRRAYSWGANGLRNSSNDQGSRYFLSTVLAVSRERGPQLSESIASLERSAAADGARPRGTFYFALTNDIRTKVRATQFPELQRALEPLGYRAEMVTQWAPMGKQDIVGLSFGVANYDWRKTNSQLLPGAIAECLTSGGGVIGKGPQTPCTEMLRYGAAGSSGAVIEPFAIPNKFPHLMIHAHYVRGATLAEAYYQAVHAPYQLLIVGDPLCRPWRRGDALQLDGLAGGEAVLQPRRIDLKEPADAVREYRVYVDGTLRATVPAGMPVTLATADLAPGSHTLLVSAVDDDLIEGERWASRQFFAGPATAAPQIEATPSAAGDSVRVRAVPRLGLGAAGGAFPLFVYQQERELGVLRTANDELTLTAQTVGGGPVRLRACARAGGQTSWSAPLIVSLSDPSRN